MSARGIYFGTLLSVALLVKLYAAVPTITVLKDPTCSCCNLWIEHLKQNGFEVIVKEVTTSVLRAMKTKYGIPPDLQTCHTATISDYVVEGHVPAADIQRLLKERPAATGLVVPGMPIGSPGMEGNKREAFSVLLLDTVARTSVYRKYPAQ
jgi:hypothetical protein